MDVLVDFVFLRIGVVGVDLVGGPVFFYMYGMFDYVFVFQCASGGGFGVIVYVGEGCLLVEICVVIEYLGAYRIGYGIMLL